jgi:SAM-dependent methyltransferase
LLVVEKLSHADARLDSKNFQSAMKDECDSFRARFAALWRRRVPSAPLCPTPEDIAFVEGRIGRHAMRLQRPARALVLGVTQELLQMDWPAGSSLVAVDWSFDMVELMLSGEQRARVAAPVVADWRRMPIPASSHDFAVGDGCYVMQSSLEDCARINTEVARVLRPDGLFCLRCFLRPDVAEDPGVLFLQAAAGQAGNPDVFRWRVGMALHGADGVGIVLDDVWRWWSGHLVAGPAPQDDKAMRETHAAMERWKGASARFTFPTREEAERLLRQRFRIVDRFTPSYAFGERFVTYAVVPA